MDNVKKVLEYFYKLEFFSPFEPSGTKLYDSREKEKIEFPIRFLEKSKNEKMKNIYSIYIGSFDYQTSLAAMEYMIQKHPTKKTNTKTTSIICGFKITEDGEYIEDTFSISSFVYGVHEIIKNNTIDVTLDEIKLNQQKQKIMEKITFPPMTELQETFAKKIYEKLLDAFAPLKENFTFEIIIQKETVYKKKDKQEESSPAILTSFYLSDIGSLIEYHDDKITHFLSTNPIKKIEIEKDIPKLKNILKPSIYPYGKWPSKNEIALMQEVAVHLSIRGNQKIYSVNGPPGSGKTTLIKEIVASNIVERAVFLSQFKNPDDAFEKKEYKEQTGHYFKLNEKLKHHSIIIASNNNFAVENISLELPKSKNLKEKFCHTNLFDTDIQKEIYFTDLAKQLNGEDSWGLLSIRLGKKSNMEEFVNTIWQPKHGKSLQDYFKKKPKDYEEKRKTFLEKFKEVQKMRLLLSGAEEDIKRKEEIEVLQTKVLSEEELKALKEEEKKLKKKLKALEKNGVTLGNKDYYKDLGKNKASQEHAPWTSQKYDKLREELFYEAIQLQKSFVLNSSCCQKNIEIFISILKNTLEPTKRAECYADVLNSFFLFVPVISTTLASVRRFLWGIYENQIGYVLIDEAGQATPSSVLGITNRGRKVIMLGDPYQIEPVVTTPHELYDILDYKKELKKSFRNPFLSAQYFADQRNSFGAKRNGSWIGTPLLLHRRCESPMFEIVNEIAYENKMISCTKKTEEKSPFLIKTSTWISRKGEEITLGNHYVKEEGEEVIRLLEKFLIENQALPNVFTISPFKTVAEELKKEVESYLLKTTMYQKEEIESWTKKNIGTIHTFQGKEANEVIIVLGCSKNSINAVRWASQKPNILNVAFSRAKKRVLIIGNEDLWREMPYFDVAYKYLKKEKYEKREN